MYDVDDIKPNSSAVTYIHTSYGDTINSIVHKVGRKTEELSGADRLAEVLQGCARPGSWLRYLSKTNGSSSLYRQADYITHTTDEWFIVQTVAHGWLHPKATEWAKAVDVSLRGNNPTPISELKGSVFFHGETLVLPRNTGDEYADMVEKLIDAAYNDMLMVRAEGRHLVLADARDFPESITTKIVAAVAEETTRQMSLTELKDYIIARSTGSVVYALTATTRNNAKCYYLNGLFPERIGRGLNAQVYGWFTEQELRNGAHLHREC